MIKDNWQRLKNLSLFKVWMTDQELERFWPWVALIGSAILLVAVVHRFFQ